MINPNYRYTHLARLIQIVNGPLPGMQAIRRLDQTFGTTYFNELFHGKTWPAYVNSFGLEDHLSDIATDYAAEIYDADDFGDWLSHQKKLQSSQGADFTPTKDKYLRSELSLDQYENSWLFGVNRTNLRRELAKNGLDDKAHYAFTGFSTRMNLTYALFARRRTGADKLYAFCLAQSILNELHLKLFELPQAALFRPLPSIELLTLGEPVETILDILQPSLAWSYDADALSWFSDQAEDTLKQALYFVTHVMAGSWPTREATEHALNLVTGKDRLNLFALCAPELFQMIVEP
jgi:hypothetical protein